jgi:hypothetical protein
MKRDPLIIRQVIVRLRALVVVSVTLATVILANLNLLPLSATWRGIVQLVCLAIIALSNPPVSRYVDPRVDQDYLP